MMAEIVPTHRVALRTRTGMVRVDVPAPKPAHRSPAPRYIMVAAAEQADAARRRHKAFVILEWACNAWIVVGAIAVAILCATKGWNW